MGTKKAMEDIKNMTYPGITMLYRDVNLGDLESRYKEGMIIREKGFTDASKKGGGLITTHRFAILSNHYLDAAEFEHATNWGLCIMQKDSHFKILDIYKLQEKTQITLLHLPEQNWRLFENIKINVDEELVAYTRKRFDECLVTKPVTELATENWLERCSFPLGMDDEGNFFSLSDE